MGFSSAKVRMATPEALKRRNWNNEGNVMGTITRSRDASHLGKKLHG
jgi:hypothetical protein